LSFPVLSEGRQWWPNKDKKELSGQSSVVLNQNGSLLSNIHSIIFHFFVFRRDRNAFDSEILHKRIPDESVLEITIYFQTKINKFKIKIKYLKIKVSFDNFFFLFFITKIMSLLLLKEKSVLE
jgi:hypothetical protein